jgi:cell division protein FtsL
VQELVFETQYVISKVMKENKRLHQSIKQLTHQAKLHRIEQSQWQQEHELKNTKLNSLLRHMKALSFKENPKLDSRNQVSQPIAALDWESQYHDLLRSLSHQVVSSTQVNHLKMQIHDLETELHSMDSSLKQKEQRCNHLNDQVDQLETALVSLFGDSTSVSNVVPFVDEIFTLLKEQQASDITGFLQFLHSRGFNQSSAFARKELLGWLNSSSDFRTKLYCISILISCSPMELDPLTIERLLNEVWDIVKASPKSLLEVQILPRLTPYFLSFQFSRVVSSILLDFVRAFPKEACHQLLASQSVFLSMVTSHIMSLWDQGIVFAPSAANAQQFVPEIHPRWDITTLHTCLTLLHRILPWIPNGAWGEEEGQGCLSACRQVESYWTTISPENPIKELFDLMRDINHKTKQWVVP